MKRDREHSDWPIVVQRSDNAGNWLSLDKTAKWSAGRSGATATLFQSVLSPFSSNSSYLSLTFNPSLISTISALLTRKSRQQIFMGYVIACATHFSLFHFSIIFFFLYFFILFLTLMDTFTVSSVSDLKRYDNGRVIWPFLALSPIFFFHSFINFFFFWFFVLLKETFCW